jgi:hypothetical protein
MKKQRHLLHPLNDVLVRDERGDALVRISTRNGEVEEESGAHRIAAVTLRVDANRTEEQL